MGGGWRWWRRRVLERGAEAKGVAKEEREMERGEGWMDEKERGERIFPRESLQHWAITSPHLAYNIFQLYINERKHYLISKYLSDNNTIHQIFLFWLKISAVRVLFTFIYTFTNQIPQMRPYPHFHFYSVSVFSHKYYIAVAQVTQTQTLQLSHLQL